MATSWSLQTANSFTTLNGAITGWQFIAGTGAQYDGSSYLLCLNSGASVSIAPSHECGTNLNFIGFGGGSDFVYNFDGAQGLAFSPLQTTVPEPASLALLATGVGGMAMASILRRRRAAV